MTTTLLISLIVSAILGAAGGYTWHSVRSKNLVRSSKRKQDEILAKAAEEARSMVEHAKQEVAARLAHKDEDYVIQAERVKRLEERIKGKEDHARRRLQSAQQKRDNVVRVDEELKAIRAHIDEARQQEIVDLSKACGMPVDHAMETMLQQINEGLEHDKLERLHRMNQFLEEDSEDRAQAILLEVLQRYSLPAVREAKEMYISLEDERVRDRLLGGAVGDRVLAEIPVVARLQELTGVECEFDEQTNVFLIHGYDLMKRTVAKMALEMALKKKRTVTPEDITEGVTVSMKKVITAMDELGKKTLKDLNINDFPKDMTRIVGRLAYRTSFGQNVLSHSMEVAAFSTLLAGAIGADIGLCKRAGLLHDLGKGVDADVDGPHDVLSRDMCVKYQINPLITHAVYAHHEQVDYVTAEDVLVQVADALSASRPGARQEATEKFQERVQEVEMIANSFPGVSKAYAIQAGREIRVIVEPEEVNDEDAARIAKDIVALIEQRMTYPGEIMVHVIRETIAVDYAR